MSQSQAPNTPSPSPSQYTSLFGYRPILTSGLITLLGTTSIFALRYNLFGYMPPRQKRSLYIVLVSGTVLSSSLVIYAPIGTYRRQMEMRQRTIALDPQAAKDRARDRDRDNGEIGDGMESVRDSLEMAWKDQAAQAQKDGDMGGEKGGRDGREL